MASSAARRDEEEGEEEEDMFANATLLAMGSILPMSMKAAVELGIFEIMARSGSGNIDEAKLSALEITSHLHTKNPEAAKMLDRILRVLASHSVITCTESNTSGRQRLYGLAPLSKLFVRNQDGVSFGPTLSLLQDKVFLESWCHLKDAVLEGGVPFNRAHGMHAYEYPSKDPRMNQVYNNAMFNQTSLVVKRMLDTYKGFEHLKQVVDVGGGLGVTLDLIISRYPSIKGVNFDLPHVIQNAPSYHGVKHVAGDMFEEVPKGDAIFLKWILHDWSDEKCLKILKNCYNSLPDKGMVIVVDAVLPLGVETSAAARCKFNADLLMMTQNSGGTERTHDEFLRLAIRAGFSGVRFVCDVCTFCIMEFYK